MGRRAALPREAVGAAELGAPAARGGPAPLPRPSHKGAQGPRFLLAPPSRPRPVGSAPVTAARAGLWAAAPAGVVRPVGGGERGARYPPPPPPGRRPLPAPSPSPPAPARTRLPPPPLTPPSAPARPPGRLRHAKAMASGPLLRLTAAPAPLLAEGKGAGAVRRRRRRRPLRAKPPLFFFLPPPPPSTHPEGFP